MQKFVSSPEVTTTWSRLAWMESLINVARAGFLSPSEKVKSVFINKLHENESLKLHHMLVIWREAKCLMIAEKMFEQVHLKIVLKIREQRKCFVCRGWATAGSTRSDRNVSLSKVKRLVTFQARQLQWQVLGKAWYSLQFGRLAHTF